MSEISDSFRAGRLAKLQDLLARRRGVLKDYLVGHQRLRRPAHLLAPLFHCARQLALDRRFRAVRHRLGGPRHAVAYPGVRLRVAALPDRNDEAAPDRHVHRRLPAHVGALVAVPGCRVMGGLRRFLRRRHAGRRLYNRDRRRGAARPAERTGHDRQQRHGPVRPRRDAGDHQLGDTGRRGRRLRRDAGGRAGWLELALSSRQRGLADRGDPLLLSAPTADLEDRHLLQAPARRALRRRCRSAVLPAVGARQAAGPGARRRRSSPASTPSSCGWST